jgi:predicted heme/steroid binding protein
VAYLGSVHNCTVFGISDPNLGMSYGGAAASIGDALYNGVVYDVSSLVDMQGGIHSCAYRARQKGAENARPSS